MCVVLISAVGGDIGQGILKSLRSAYPHARIIGCDINPNSPGLFLCDKSYIVAGAKNDEKKYIQDIVQICKKEKVDIVFSAQPYELNVLCPLRCSLQNWTGAFFAIQTGDVWGLSMDKLRTYQFLKKAEIRSPETYATQKGFDVLRKKYGYPVLVKARTSLGSGFHGYRIIDKKKDFNEAWQQIKNPIVQEYVTDENNEEYTVGIFLNRKSKALGAIPMLRELRFGITFHAIVDDFFDVTDIAVKAAESIQAIGPCNVQLRRDRTGKLCVIEINARISSTTAFRAHFGFNEARACIDYFLDNKKPHLSYTKGVAMKAWNEVYTSISQYHNLKEKGVLSL
jgi:carbamoyl-phosphate synthase large subunit